MDMVFYPVAAKTNNVYCYFEVLLEHSGLVVMMLLFLKHVWPQSSFDEDFVQSIFSVFTVIIVGIYFFII